MTTPSNQQYTAENADKLCGKTGNDDKQQAHQAQSRRKGDIQALCCTQRLC
jgi:hypothetical protein